MVAETAETAAAMGAMAAIVAAVMAEAMAAIVAAVMAEATEAVMEEEEKAKTNFFLNTFYPDKLKPLRLDLLYLFLQVFRTGIVFLSF